MPRGDISREFRSPPAAFRPSRQSLLHIPVLRHKAALNLRAGDALSALGLADPAASRYYYALFQAAVHALTQRGWTPGRVRSGAVEWDHSMVMNNVAVIRGRRSDRVLYGAMRELRELADYHGDLIAPGALATQVAAVRDFVEEVIR